MKKMFLIGAGVACLAFIGCSSQKDVSMSETSEGAAKSSDCSNCTAEKAANCTECPDKASPAVIGDKSHCEGQTGECPFSKKN